MYFQDMLVRMSEDGLQPNMMTFGCLAMGCYRLEGGMQLLDHAQVDLTSPQSISF
jgi:hypothetical protein